MYAIRSYYDPLDVGAVDHGVGELGQAGLALDQQDGHAELHAELGLQLVLRAVMNQGVWHVSVGADLDLDDSYNFV